MSFGRIEREDSDELWETQILKRRTQKSNVEEEDKKDDTRIILDNEINSLINICLITADPDK